jgi:hypothetical protein
MPNRVTFDENIRWLAKLSVIVDVDRAWFKFIHGAVDVVKHGKKQSRIKTRVEISDYREVVPTIELFKTEEELLEHWRPKLIALAERLEKLARDIRVRAS